MAMTRGYILGEGAKGKWEVRGRGRERGKEKGDHRPPTIFGLNVALKIHDFTV